MQVIPLLRQRQGSLRLSPRWSNKKPIFIVAPWMHMQASSLHAARYTANASTPSMESYGLVGYAAGDGVGVTGTAGDPSITLTVDTNLASRLCFEFTVLSVIGAIPTAAPAGNSVTFCRTGSAGDPTYTVFEAPIAATTLRSALYSGGYNYATSDTGQHDLTQGITAAAQTWGPACEFGHMVAYNGRVVARASGGMKYPSTAPARIDLGVGMYRIPVYFHIIFNSTFTQADLAELTSQPFALFDSGIAYEMFSVGTTAAAEAGADVVATAGVSFTLQGEAEIVADAAVTAAAGQTMAGVVGVAGGADVAVAAMGGMFEFYNPVGYSPPTAPITLDFNEVSYGVVYLTSLSSGVAEPTMYTDSPPAVAEAGASCSAQGGLLVDGAAAIEAGADVAPTAYRILNAGWAFSSAGAEGAVDAGSLASGRVIRNAKVRSKAGADFVAYPHRQVAAVAAGTAGATVAVQAFVSLGNVAAIEGGVDVVAYGTLVMGVVAGGMPMSGGADVAAYPWLTVLAAADVAAGADTTAWARKSVVPSTFIESDGTVTAAAVVNIAAAAAFTADATGAVSTSTVTRQGEVAAAAGADATADGLAGMPAAAAISGEATVVADAIRTAFVTTAVSGTATAVGAGTAAKPAASAMSATATATVAASLTVAAQAAIEGSATVNVFGIRNLAILSQHVMLVEQQQRGMVVEREDRAMWVHPEEVSDPGVKLPMRAEA